MTIAERKYSQKKNSDARRNFQKVAPLLGCVAITMLSTKENEDEQIFESRRGCGRGDGNNHDVGQCDGASRRG
jgi:hypothetical protein